ncbi:hypothetical protein LQW54_004162 [Pestalotiopsis sp. IQ-011]
MPFCIHNPLLVQISIFTVACFLTETRQLDEQQSILIKGQTIRMLNERLRSTEDAISDAAIAGVCQLIVNEWYWGDMDELRAHLKGMRHMIQLRGGYQNLGLEGLLSKMVIVADFGIAMTFEVPPYLQEGKEFQFEDRKPVEHKVFYQSPLAASDSSFASCAQVIGLHPTTASILDDIRFLIALAISTPIYPDAQQTQKLKWTADWIQNRIEALPSSSPASELQTTISTSGAPQPGSKGGQAQSSATLTSTSGAARQAGSESPDYLYQSIRQAALVYTRAIAAGKPFSRACTPDDFHRLWVTIWRVPLGAWKSLVGVFLWVEAAVLAAARDTPHGRFVRSMFNIAALTLAVEDWETGVAALRGALALQARLGGREIEAST